MSVLGYNETDRELLIAAFGFDKPPLWRNKATGTVYVSAEEPFPGCSVWMVETEAGSRFNVRRKNLEQVSS